MRNLLIVLLVCGVAFLGYQFLRRGGSAPDRPVRAAGRQAAGGATVAPAKVVHAPPVVLDDAGPMRLAAGDGTEDGARWREALRQRDFRGIEFDPGARERHALGSPARFALEVAAALAGEAPGDVPALRQAAEALRKSGGGDTAVLLADGWRVLTEAGRPAAAVAAVAGSNEFLAAPGAALGQEAFLAAADHLPPERRALVLSAYVDALTRGRTPIWGRAYPLLSAAYGALQEVLSMVVFNREGSWRSCFREVRSGDSLARIANSVERELRIPMSAGLLQRVNGIRHPKRLRAGTRLRIPTEEIRVVVEKSTYSMKVLLGDVLIRLYRVGLGENDCTPEDRFVVSEKQRNPAWTDPRTGELIPAGDPRNLVGEYFVKLDHPVHQGYGLHGTEDPTSIGRDASMGCIRLKKTDMAGLFAYLPRRTQVLVRR